MYKQWEQRSDRATTMKAKDTTFYKETSQLNGAVFRPFQTLCHQVAVKQLPIIPTASFLSCNRTPTVSLSSCQSLKVTALACLFLHLLQIKTVN